MLEVAIEADPEWDSRPGQIAETWSALALAAVEAAIAESAFPQLVTAPRAVELSIRLGSDAEVHALNSEWRGKDSATNVLSFPMAGPEELKDAVAPGPELMLGDIILARETCAREADDKAITLEHHAAHLMIHGTLHLLGYDHGEDSQANDMELRETRALARIGVADPYGDRG